MSSGAIVGAEVVVDSSLRSRGTGVVWTDGEILFIGAASQASAIADGRGLPVIDGEGGLVIPGLIDSHVHLAAIGHQEFTTDLSDARSVDEVIDLMHQAAHSEDLLHARGLDESKLSEGRPPTRSELDAAFPTQPVVVDDRGLHYVICNSAAIRELGLERHDRWPTGRVPDDESGVVRQAIGERLSPERRRQAIMTAAMILADGGFTSAHAIEGGELFDDGDIPVIQEIAGDLPIEIVLYWNTTNVEAVAASGYPRIGGDIFVDGSIGSRTAYLHEAYSDAPESRGTLIRDKETLARLIRSADDAQLQIAFHAIGDAAIDVLLEAFADVRTEETDSRHRIEHMGLTDAFQIERAASLGLVVSTQPAFAYLRGGRGSVYESRLGPSRLGRAYPLADLAQSGIVVAAGTDAPVTPPDGLLGLHSATNHPNSSQRVSLGTALEWFTLGAARAAHQEHRRGRLAPGFSADLVLLGDDIRKISTDAISQVPVELTVSRGRMVGGRRVRGNRHKPDTTPTETPI